MSKRTTPPAVLASMIVGVVAVVGLVGAVVWGGGGTPQDQAWLSPSPDPPAPCSSVPEPGCIPDPSPSPEPDPSPSPVPIQPLSLRAAADLRDLPGGSAPLDLSGGDLSTFPDMCAAFDEAFLRAAMPVDWPEVASVEPQQRQMSGSVWRSGCEYTVRLDEGGSAAFIVTVETPNSVLFRAFDERRDRVLSDPDGVDLGASAAGGSCFMQSGLQTIDCTVADTVFQMRSHGFFLAEGLDEERWLAEVVLPLVNNVATRIITE